MGNSYDHTTSRCQLCEAEEAQFVCKPCPVTKSTAGTGSTSQSQCIGEWHHSTHHYIIMYHELALAPPAILNV